MYDLGADTLIAGAARAAPDGAGVDRVPARPDGKTVHAQYVLADRSAQIVGHAGRVRRRDAADGPLPRQRPAADVDVDHRLVRRHLDGPDVTWLRRGCVRGVLRVPVHSRSDALRGRRAADRGLGLDDAVRRPASVDGARRRSSCRCSRSGGVCRIHFAITPTRRPIDYPALNNPDPRELGVLATGFQYEPAPGA